MSIIWIINQFDNNGTDNLPETYPIHFVKLSNWLFSYFYKVSIAHHVFLLSFVLAFLIIMKNHDFSFVHFLDCPLINTGSQLDDTQGNRTNLKTYCISLY